MATLSGTNNEQVPRRHMPLQTAYVQVETLLPDSDETLTSLINQWLQLNDGINVEVLKVKPLMHTRTSDCTMYVTYRQVEGRRPVPLDSSAYEKAGGRLKGASVDIIADTIRGERR
jgi:hypothetical protein